MEAVRFFELKMRTHVSSHIQLAVSPLCEGGRSDEGNVDVKKYHIKSANYLFMYMNSYRYRSDLTMFILITTNLPYNNTHCIDLLVLLLTTRWRYFKEHFSSRNKLAIVPPCAARVLQRSLWSEIVALSGNDAALR